MLFVIQKLGTDCFWLIQGMKEAESEPYVVEMDLAFSQIGKHLDWLRGQFGVERENWKNIAIDKEMAKKLAKLGRMEIRTEIFRELAGRNFSDNQKLDEIVRRMGGVNILKFYYIFLRNGNFLL